MRTLAFLTLLRFGIEIVSFCCAFGANKFSSLRARCTSGRAADRLSIRVGALAHFDFTLISFAGGGSINQIEPVRA
jgi:hypothetical protein